MHADIKTCRRERINRTANAKINVSIFNCHRSFIVIGDHDGIDIFNVRHEVFRAFFRINEINMIPVFR